MQSSRYYAVRLRFLFAISHASVIRSVWRLPETRRQRPLHAPRTFLQTALTQSLQSLTLGYTDNWTVERHAVIRLLLITLADVRLSQSPVKASTSHANCKCIISSFQFPFSAFLFPFYYPFGLIRYRFISVFTDIFVSVFVFVNRICLNLFCAFPFSFPLT